MKRTFKSILILAALAPACVLASKIETSRHGEGLPSYVGIRKAAENYRNEFKRIHNITSYKKFGITHYNNNRIGLGLIKKGNTDENAFRDILKKTTNDVRKWRTGNNFLDQLKDYTQEKGCIPKVVSTSHGWASSEDGGDFHGLSGRSRRDGIYSTDEAQPGIFSKLYNRSITGDLKKMINEGEVKFCNRCVVQFYACNVSTEFAKAVAQTTGCQTVVATGKAYPNFQKMDSAEDRNRVWNGAHYWASGAANWSERGFAEWFRATPIKNSYGDLEEMIEENLGPLYIAL